MSLAILALACGAFVLGAAEFVMMGILPDAAASMMVSIPQAGSYISAYAIGVCIGTIMLVVGRRIPPRTLIAIFMIITAIGNLLSALSVNSPMLIAARFIAGLPHGAFFGTATLIAQRLAKQGEETRAVSLMVTGQTVANMLGVPLGTWLTQIVSWRVTFAILTLFTLFALALTITCIPFISPVADAGLLGQFRFLARPGPWIILIAVFSGNAGIFSWWSYVANWLTDVGTFADSMVAWLMMLAGFGMVLGGLLGGKLSDRLQPATTACIGQAAASVGLLLVFVSPGTQLVCALLTFLIAFGLFFVSSPQQSLMAHAGKGGGELIGGAMVQVAFNFGNAVGSIIGGSALHAHALNYRFTALGGLSFALAAVLLLAAYGYIYEHRTTVNSLVASAQSQHNQYHPEQVRNVKTS